MFKFRLSTITLAFVLCITKLVASATPYEITPNYYEIRCNGISTQISSFPLMHNIAKDVIPASYWQKIRDIAEFPGSKLYTEMSQNDWNIKEACNLLHDSYKLDIEEVVKFESTIEEIRREKSDTAECGVTKPLIIFEYEKKEMLSKWTDDLPPALREALSELCPLDHLNTRDPFLVERYLANNLEALLDSEGRIIRHIDNVIEDTFNEHERIVTSLESNSDREAAIFSEISAQQRDCFHMTRYKLKRLIDKIKKVGEYIRTGEAYITQVEDMDFQDPSLNAYLQGNAYYEPSIEVDERNKKWWDDKIFPLLQEVKKKIEAGEPLSPILMIYGQAHDEGPEAIINKIISLEGFTVHKLINDDWGPAMEPLVFVAQRRPGCGIQ